MTEAVLAQGRRGSGNRGSSKICGLVAGAQEKQERQQQGEYGKRGFFHFIPQINSF
jgi:hypothetical protein